MCVCRVDIYIYVCVLCMCLLHTVYRCWCVCVYVLAGRRTNFGEAVNRVQSCEVCHRFETHWCGDGSGCQPKLVVLRQRQTSIHKRIYASHKHFHTTNTANTTNTSTTPNNRQNTHMQHNTTQQTTPQQPTQHRTHTFSARWLSNENTFSASSRSIEPRTSAGEVEANSACVA